MEDVNDPLLPMSIAERGEMIRGFLVGGDTNAGF